MCYRYSYFNLSLWIIFIANLFQVICRVHCGWEGLVNPHYYHCVEADDCGIIHCHQNMADSKVVHKLRRVKGETNFISSGLKIVKRLRRRQYDPVIIERTIGLVLGPFTAFYRSFLKSCTLPNKAVGTIWLALSKPQRRQGPDPHPLWLFFETPSAFGPELTYRLRVAQPTLMDVPIYLCPLDWMIGGILFLSCLFICLSVCCQLQPFEWQEIVLMLIVV